MCLLITGKSNAVRAQLLHTEGLIDDIFFNNADGLGVMYVTSKQQVKVVKRLPLNAEAARQIVAALPNDDRMVAMHWRMRTHGDIDLENCHPYQINGASWMMHNGVLKTGNAKDKTKSDTWHFARDFLAEMSPDALHDPGVLYLLGKFIDNNRFAIMSADGRLSVVNEEQGIEHEDVWYSNTYAWSPEMLIPEYRVSSGYGWAFGGHLSADLGDWVSNGRGSYAPRYTGASNVVALPGTTPSADIEDAEMDASFYGWVEETVIEAMNDIDVSTMTAILSDEDSSAYAIDFILDTFHLVEHNPREALADRVDVARGYWLRGTPDVLKVMAKNTPSHVAEALLYFCDWTVRSGPATSNQSAATGNEQVVLGNGFSLVMPAVAV